MKALSKYWRYHGTKVLGTIQVVVAGLLAVPEVIAQPHMKYWLAANAILGGLTVRRGFTNSKP